MNDIESNIINLLKSQYKLKIEEANFAKGLIPKYILLDRTRNIHSYIVPTLVQDKIIETYYNVSCKSDTLELLYKLQFSSLDRPLFLVFKYELDLFFLDIKNFESCLHEQKNIKTFLDNKIHANEMIPKLKIEL